jgi:uncharacterized membrane protein
MELQKKLNVKVRDIAIVGMMAAIIYLATAIINVPSPYKGVLHAGDSMVFAAAVLFGRKKSAVAAAIGMSLFDLLSPYAIWAPFTFFIKGSMAYLAAVIAYRSNNDGKNVKNNIIAFAAAGLWMTFAYFIAGNILSVFAYGLTLNVSLLQNALDIPSNILQVVVGMVIAVPLTRSLKKVNFR